MVSQDKVPQEKHRREVLKYTGALAGTSLAGIAGCIGGNGDNGNGTNEDNSDGGNDYPNQQVDIIVPYGAGGGSDTYARKFSEVLGENLGVEFPVSNVTGAGAMNGQQEMTTSQSDGYTLSATVQPGNATSYLSQDLDFGFENTKAVASYVSDANLLVASPDLDVRNDFEKLAQMYRDGELELLGVMENTLTHAAGIKMDVEDEWGISFDRYVGYDGVAECYRAVGSGEIPATFGAASSAVSSIRDGQVEPVVLCEETTSDADVLADTPTLPELGYSEFGALGALWRGLLAPPETPDDKIATLENAIEEAVNSDEIQSWSEETGNPVSFTPHEDAQQKHQNAFEVYRDLNLDEEFN